MKGVKKMKKLLTICIFGLIIFNINTVFAKDNSNSSLSSNIEYTSENEKIHIISSNNIKKVKWDKQFIDYTIIDENIIKNKKANNENVDKILENKFTGDFLSITQKRIGKIKTDNGEFDLIWIYRPDVGYASFICNSAICKPVRLKETTENKAILFGDYKELIQNNKEYNNIKSDELVGLAYIKLNTFLNSKPTLNVILKNLVKENKNIITWNNDIEQDENNNDVYSGTINNKEKTKIKLFVNKEKEVLTMADNTILFTKHNNQENFDDVTLFYLDFDNDKNPNTINIVSVANVSLININDFRKISKKVFFNFK